MVAELKEITSNKGHSLASLEKAAGLGKGTIRKWDESSPSLANLNKVADVLGIKVTTLINRTTT